MKKVLCPVDFSEVSLNACQWIVSLLAKITDGEISFLHCINIESRASLFVDIEELFKRKATEDMNLLLEKMRIFSSESEFDGKIVVSNPKSYIPKFAKSNEYDLVVTGSKGLTALNEVFFGSVTAHIINKSITPILTIPLHSKFKGFRKAVLAVDDKSITNKNSVFFLKNLLRAFDAELKIVHVQEEAEKPYLFDPNLDTYFAGIRIEKKLLTYAESIVGTVNEYCKTEEADVLCMIHRKYNWFEQFFHKSFTKSELYELKIPLLILPD